MSARFSKTLLQQDVQQRINEIQQEHHFDVRNGWQQVVGRAPDVQRAYGAFDALYNLAMRLDLDVVVSP